MLQWKHIFIAVLTIKTHRSSLNSCTLYGYEMNSSSDDAIFYRATTQKQGNESNSKKKQGIL